MPCETNTLANRVVMDAEMIWLADMMKEQDRLEDAIITCGCVNCHRLLDWINQEIDKELRRIQQVPPFDHEEIRDIKRRHG